MCRYVERNALRAGLVRHAPEEDIRALQHLAGHLQQQIQISLRPDRDVADAAELPEHRLLVHDRRAARLQAAELLAEQSRSQVGTIGGAVRTDGVWRGTLVRARRDGSTFLTGFRLEEGMPFWTYDIEGVQIEKRVLMLHEPASKGALTTVNRLRQYFQFAGITEHTEAEALVRALDLSGPLDGHRGVQGVHGV